MEMSSKVEQAQELLADVNIHGPAGFVTCTDLDTEGGLIIGVTFSYNPPFALATVVCGGTMQVGIHQLEAGDYDPVAVSKAALRQACLTPAPDSPLSPEQLTHVYEVYEHNINREAEERARSERLNDLFTQMMGGMTGDPFGISAPDDENDEDDDGASLMSARDAFGEMLGRKVAREGKEWPEENCPDCAHRVKGDCPILNGFVAEQIIIAAEKNAHKPDSSPEA